MLNVCSDFHHLYDPTSSELKSPLLRRIFCGQRESAYYNKHTSFSPISHIETNDLGGCVAVMQYFITPHKKLISISKFRFLFYLFIYILTSLNLLYVLDI